MPKRVDPEERRRHIAAALLAVISRDGLEAVSLRHVAAEAGVTAGMVQHYFPSKDAMMQFAMHTASGRYAQRIAGQVSLLGAQPRPQQIIRALAASLLPADDDEAHDARVALGFQAYAANHGDASASLADGNRMLREHLAGLLESVGAGGNDPRIGATVLLATAEGLAVAMLSARLPRSVALQALDFHIALLLKPGAEGVPAASAPV